MMLHKGFMVLWYRKGSCCDGTEGYHGVMLQKGLHDVMLQKGLHGVMLQKGFMV